jgi:cysteine desulfurase
VQGFLKLPVTPRALGADLITISAHKIHGPKGVGALYVSQRILTARALVPIYGGGGQEFGFRSGTENMIGIAGFAGAVRAGFATRAQDARTLAALSERLCGALADGEIRVNHPAKHAPHIVNVTLPDIKSETMLHFLSDKGIAVSSGSACSSHAKTPSRALISFGLTPSEADCSLRISLCAKNTPEEIDALVQALRQGLSALVRIHH